jgi:hypothetical protein
VSARTNLPDAEYYFPKLGANSFDSLYFNWGARALKQLNEPSLFMLEYRAAAESYRLTLLPTWEPPLCIRVTFAKDGSAAARLKILSRNRDGGLLAEKTVVLSAEVAEGVRSAFKGTSFWKASPLGVGAEIDGTHWIIEALEKEKYHVTFRPNIGDGAVREVATKLLEIFGGRTAVYKPYYDDFIGSRKQAQRVRDEQERMLSNLP